MLTPNQSLVKETRLTVIGLDYSERGLFPEPVAAQMRVDTRGPSPARKRDTREKRDGTAIHICHSLSLSLLPGCLPLVPS